MKIKICWDLTAFSLPLKDGLKRLMLKELFQRLGDMVERLHIETLLLNHVAWLGAEFKFYLKKEYRRLKEDETDRLQLEWSFRRTLAKVNYQIHADAIKENLIPDNLDKFEILYMHGSEADVLNTKNEIVGQEEKDK